MKSDLLDALGIDFITLRRRHAALSRRIHSLDKSTWMKIRLSNIGRAYRTPSVVDDTIKRDSGEIRRVTLVPTKMRQELLMW
jgi:hypothetical protein